jgi:CheY-like chemotaxis protein
MARILICEDEHIVALDIQQQLEQGGHQVVGLVDSGEEAISLAQKGNIDLVLMDIHLRGQLDGIEAGSKIYHNHAIPIILLTAYNDEQTIKRAEKIQPFALS